MAAHLEPREPAPPIELGRWGRLPPEIRAVPAAAPDSDAASEPAPQPLAWETSLPLAARLRRAASVPTIVGMLVFALALVITAWFVLRGAAEDSAAHAAASPTETVAIATDEQELRAAAGSSAGELPGAASGAPISAGAVFVHVVGEVREPGVVELESGARLSEAIDAAGGPTPDAMLAGVNLARLLVDGEQIVVPNAEEFEAGGAVGAAGAPGVSGIPGAAAPAQAQGAAGGSIDLNRATSADLEQLSGIGPALAARIIEWRDSNGGFTSVDQLLDVSGIGEKTLARFRDRVTV